MSTTLPKEVLTKYKSKNFVETGTLWGDAVQLALECGFEKVYSIEIDPAKVKSNLERFAKEIEEGKVVIIEGDTFEVFGDVLKQIKGTTTFWLDAHWDGDVAGQYKCPLPFELENISKMKSKSHTILIDDRRIFGDKGSTWGWEITEDQIIEKVLAINSKYTISYENGHVPNDIIVAQVIK
jgi:hypothetical protein